LADYSWELRGQFILKELAIVTGWTFFLANRLVRLKYRVISLIKGEADD